jgi:hypothetical protein
MSRVLHRNLPLRTIRRLPVLGPHRNMPMHALACRRVPAGPGTVASRSGRAGQVASGKADRVDGNGMSDLRSPSGDDEFDGSRQGGRAPRGAASSEGSPFKVRGRNGKPGRVRTAGRFGTARSTSEDRARVGPTGAGGSVAVRRGLFSWDCASFAVPPRPASAGVGSGGNARSLSRHSPARNWGRCRAECGVLRSRADRTAERHDNDRPRASAPQGVGNGRATTARAADAKRGTDVSARGASHARSGLRSMPVRVMDCRRGGASRNGADPQGLKSGGNSGI